MFDAIEAGLLDIALWLKAGHLIFAFFWIAGLFMLPRFFVYHSAAEPGSAEDKAWIEREARLKKIILTPSLIVVWILGLTLAMTVGAFAMGWFHAKLLFVLLLTAFHGIMVARSKKMIAGDRPMSEKQLRMWGEFPGIMLAIIVILVIVKPF